MSEDFYTLAQKNKALKANQAAYAQKGAENIGSAFGTAMDALSYPQEVLKEYVGENVLNARDDKEWFSSEGMNPHLYALGNTAADFVLDPLNVVGAGLFTKGVKGVKAAGKVVDDLTGSLSGKGMFLNNFSNYIDSWYGVKNSSPKAFDKNVSETVNAIVPNTASPAKIEGVRKKLAGFGAWGAEGMKEAVKMLVDPKARAVYKDLGVSPAAVSYVSRALADNELHKGMAQVQYLSHIARQAGREGVTADEIRKVMEASGFTDYFAYSSGSYADAIKANKLIATKNGRQAQMSDDDLGIIENHFGSVWKAPDNIGTDVAFKDAEGSLLFIKNTANKNTGDHYNDVLKNGGYIGSVYNIFKNTKNAKPSIEELWSGMKKASGKEGSRWKLAPVSQTLEDAKKNGLWITGSKKGSAYTEGGVNYITRVKPNGDLVSVMSDEHNFFETLAGKADAVARTAGAGQAPLGAGLLTALNAVIPHRLVAVTPPMHNNIYNLRQQLGVVGPNIKNPLTKPDKTTREMLTDFVNAPENVNPNVVAAEQARQQGAVETLAGAGLLARPEEE